MPSKSFCACIMLNSINQTYVAVLPLHHSPKQRIKFAWGQHSFAWGAWGQQKICLGSLGSLGTKENLLGELGVLFNQKSEKFSVNQSYLPNF